MKENFLVTGGAGYVGKILVQKLIDNPNVDKIIVIDKSDLDVNLVNNSKVYFIHKNLIDNWEEDVWKLEIENGFKVTKVVHLAWQIRTMYGKRNLQNKWNIFGSQKVFEFVKKHDNVKTLVHFSTVASYGAFSTNSFQEVFTEEKPFRKTDYLYAEEKRIVEENLDNISWGKKDVFVIRPASITGPLGRERTSFGLQSALAGKIKSKNFLENFIFNIIKKFLNFMPATHGWARQFVHEEDIVQAVLVMSFYKGGEHRTIQKYNLCPHFTDVSRGELNYIDAKEMGAMLNKRVVYLPPFVVRLLSFLAWHGTLGKVPTSTGVWKAYSYPIIVDGSKIERDFPNFKYQKSIREAYLDNSVK